LRPLTQTFFAAGSPSVKVSSVDVDNIGGSMESRVHELSIKFKFEETHHCTITTRKPGNGNSNYVTPRF
jgi:hypothetical protein